MLSEEEIFEYWRQLDPNEEITISVDSRDDIVHHVWLSLPTDAYNLTFQQNIACLKLLNWFNHHYSNVDFDIKKVYSPNGVHECVVYSLAESKL
jgi:hypothetical protein